MAKSPTPRKRRGSVVATAKVPAVANGAIDAAAPVAAAAAVKASSKKRSKILPFSKRPLDWLYVFFFVINLVIITYIVDIEQIILPVQPLINGFKYPVWPTKWWIDLIHWYASNFDPLLLARPVWYRATIWIDSLFFGPMYALMIWAFYKGDERIRIPVIVYSSVICTIVTIICSEEVWGPNSAASTGSIPLVLALNASWFLFPLSLIVRFGISERPFSGFLDKHPGGREMLLLAAGRECTELFESYHAFVSNPARPLKFLNSMEVGVITGPTEYPMYSPDSKGFYSTLRTRVKAYFERTGYGLKAPAGGLLRMAPVFALFIACFAIMGGQLWPGSSFGVKAFAAIVFGICQVMPLLHIMHDASHTAIGPNETWWKVIGRGTLDWMCGASMMSWHHQHIIGHHVYTNVFLADPDLPAATTGDIRRLVPRQIWAASYKWQWIYLPLAYGLLALKFRTQDFTDLWLARTNGPIRVNMYDNPLYRVVFTKAVWAAWRIALPLLLWGVPLSTYIALFIIAELASGYWLAFNFQVSHISTGMEWFNGDADSRVLADCWAVAQVKSSLDYGHDDMVMTYLCGALNYQIEHHLFPGISQYHYPALAPIVLATCKEFNVPYRYERTFWDALRCHVQYLYDLGLQGKVPHSD